MGLHDINRKYLAATAVVLTAAAAAAAVVDTGPSARPAAAQSQVAQLSGLVGARQPHATPPPTSTPTSTLASAPRPSGRSRVPTARRLLPTRHGAEPRHPATPAHGPDADRTSNRSEAAAPSDVTTSVAGTWYGDVSCIPTAAAPKDASTFAVRCDAATGYSGAWVGHSVVVMVGTIDTAGVARLDYDEWFVGAYTGDNTTGGLHFRGSLIASAESFRAEAAIIDGSCGFAGSRGHVHYEGSSAASGPYTARWIRPAHRPPADTVCVPTLPSPTELL